jgi:hypothetical protein
MNWKGFGRKGSWPNSDNIHSFIHSLYLVSIIATTVTSQQVTSSWYLPGVTEGNHDKRQSG